MIQARSHPEVAGAVLISAGPRQFLVGRDEFIEFYNAVKRGDYDTVITGLQASNPVRGADRAAKVEAAALAMMERRDRESHGQLCPVWLRTAPYAECDCWELRNKRADAQAAVTAIEALR